METFIKVVPSKEKEWINDVYYGTIGYTEHGHLVASGAICLGVAVIVKGTMKNFECEQPLYHRNAERKVLLSTGVRR